MRRLPCFAPLLAALFIVTAAHARPVDDAACIAADAPWRGAVRERGEAPAGESFHVASYNLHSGLGGGHGLRARKRDVEQNLGSIAASIAAQRPDVVALNEVDFDSDRSARIDQAQFVADRLLALTGARYEIARVLTFRRDLPGMRVRFGSAILSRHRIVDEGTCVLEEGKPCFAPKAQHALPELAVRSLLTRLGGERRAAVKATLDVRGRKVDVVVTHLEAFDKDDREAQAAHILARMVVPGRTTILAGDMNSVPAAFPERGLFPDDDRTHDVLTSRGLMDPRLYLLAANGKAGDGARYTPASFATFPSDAPKVPIDDILATTDLLPTGMRVFGGTESDHKGIAATFRIVDAPAARALDVVHARMKEKQVARLLACAAPGARDRAKQAGFLVDATGLADAATTEGRVALIEAVLPLEGGAHVQDVFESAHRAGPDRLSALVAKLKLDEVRAKLSVNARARLDRFFAATHEEVQTVQLAAQGMAPPPAPSLGMPPAGAPPQQQQGAPREGATVGVPGFALGTAGPQTADAATEGAPEGT